MLQARGLFVITAHLGAPAPQSAAAPNNIKGPSPLISLLTVPALTVPALSHDRSPVSDQWTQGAQAHPFRASELRLPGRGGHRPQTVTAPVTSQPTLPVLLSPDR